MMIVWTFVIGFSRPILSENYFEVNFKKIKLPSTAPVDWQAFRIVVIKETFLNYFRQSPSMAIFYKLLKKYTKINITANVLASACSVLNAKTMNSIPVIS